MSLYKQPALFEGLLLCHEVINNLIYVYNFLPYIRSIIVRGIIVN